MGKGANKQLLANSGTAQSNSNQLSSAGTKINGYLTPTLEAEANNPQGYTPQQMAYMNTASQQSLGGSTAGVTGQANLTAARTRNAGGFQGAIGSGSRAGARQLSQNALGIQTQQAQLQQQQRQQALQALQSLYGVDESTALGYLNSSNSALNMENASHPNQQGLLTAGTFVEDLAQAAKSGAQADQAAGGGCWIAAAVYEGWSDPRTIQVREWLNNEFTKQITGKVVMGVYRAIGRQVAWFVRRSPLLQKAFRPLFDKALARARGTRS